MTKTATRGSVYAPLSALMRPVLWLPVLSLVMFLTAWEIVGRNIDPLLFAPPSRVAEVFPRMVASGELAAATSTTLNTLAVGYVLAVIVGIGLGVLLAQFPVAERLATPYLYGIFSTPRVVLVPLIIMWFGVGYGGRLFLVFLWSMIAIAVSTTDGVRNTRRDLIEVARSAGANRLQTIRHVLLPAAVPFVVSGLRVGAERAIVGVVIGEMFLQLTGLGGLLQDHAQSFATAEMLSVVLIIAAMGTALILAIDAIERRVSSWRPDN